MMGGVFCWFSLLLLTPTLLPGTEAEDTCKKLIVMLMRLMRLIVMLMRGDINFMAVV